MTEKTNILKTARDEDYMLTYGSYVIRYAPEVGNFVYVHGGTGFVSAERLSSFDWQPYTPPKSKQDELEEAWVEWQKRYPTDSDTGRLYTLLIERLRELGK